jgi:hypothetical protein
LQSNRRDKDVDFLGPISLGFTDRVDQQFHLVTARLNYRFGWGGPGGRALLMDRRSVGSFDHKNREAFAPGFFVSNEPRGICFSVASSLRFNGP